MERKKFSIFCLSLLTLLNMTACNPSRGANSPKSDTFPTSSPKEEFVSGFPGASEGCWSKIAPMYTPRYDFGSEVMDGKIYVFGGKNESGQLSSTEVYDIQSNTWKRLKPMLEARSNFQTAALNGEIYAIGGSQAKFTGMGVTTAAVEKYNPAVNTWVPLRPMRVERMYHQLAVLDGIIYAIGGSADSSVLPAVEAYDPSSDTWTDKTPMSVPRMQFGTAVIGGKIYVIGGCTTEKSLETVEMYDPKTDQWTKKAPMQTPRFSFQTEVIEGKIYVMGGLNDKADSLASVEEYDPAADKWTTKRSMKTPRSWFQSTAANGKILAVGGWRKVGDYLSQSFLSSVEEYNPKSDTWTEKLPLLPARSLFKTIHYGGNLFAIGGAVGSNTQAEPGTNSAAMYKMIK